MWSLKKRTLEIKKLFMLKRGLKSEWSEVRGIGQGGSKGSCNRICIE